MKKTLLFVSVILFTAIIYSCNTPCKKPASLVGEWEFAKNDSTIIILELAEDQTWKVFKNDELGEEGTYAIEENIFIMKHKVEEHDHGHGEEHDDHHAHPEDHRYEFALNENKTELSLISEEKTTLFKKIK